MGEGHIVTPYFKRPQGNYKILGNRGSYGRFVGNGSKSTSSSKSYQGRLKEVKAESNNSRFSSVTKNVKRKSNDNKNFESWSKAKTRLFAEAFSKRRITNACMNCGEVIGKKISECPKQEPCLHESIVDSAMQISYYISAFPYVLDESCIIK